MRNITMLPLALSTSLLLAISACQTKTPNHTSEPIQEQASAAKDIPQIGSPKTIKYTPSTSPAIKTDPKLEQRIQNLLSKMTLEQKVGQMIQVRIGDTTLQEITEYGIGSVLNGGGQTPNDKADSTAKEWAAYADAMYQASIQKHPSSASIPIIWGTDAVHGHNNVKGAVLYPHNIGLGATNNPELVKKIAEATALSVAATGIDWNFAPTVATARDYRWGRTYESFSENPTLVSILGAKVVEGLQGAANTKQFLDQNHVIATAKHFIGDGGTAFGDDQGYTYGKNDKLLPLHLPGYVTAINSGVQTIMASYNFWNGTHSHANKAMLTDLLKDQLQFDGVIVSDWQAIAHIPGCSLDSCAEAINAGVDIFMIPKAPDWKKFHQNTIAQVKAGTVSISRIDDAVLRILRVKMRAGLWDKPSPAKRSSSGKSSLIGSPKNRALARQAVRESLVLLKNNGVLPLRPKHTYLVAGTGANNISMQSGGWSVTWQGADNSNDKYVGATSIYQGIKQAVNAAGGKVLFSELGQVTEKVKAAIVVFGEQPYAEMYGDIQNLQTLEFERETKNALNLINKLKSKGIPVVSIFLSGRPMWVNKELNASDGFISAWLPGSEGQGVADLLFLKANGKLEYDFTGKLSFSWPKQACDASLNWGDPNYDPLHPTGFGLSYTDPIQPWVPLNEDAQAWELGCRLGNKTPEVSDVHFTQENNWHFYAEQKSLSRIKVDRKVTLGAMTAEPDSEITNSINATWDGSEEGRLDLRNDSNKNEFLNMLANKGAIMFDLRVEKLGKKPLKAAIYSGHLGGSTIDINKLIGEAELNKWLKLSIDLSCFSDIRADMNKISIPFGLHSDGAHKLAIANVRYEAHKAHSATMNCQKK